MCERSNRPTRSRTARCSSMIEVYWTGIRQPENSIIRAWSAVVAVRERRLVNGVALDRGVGHEAASAAPALARGIPTVGRSVAEQVRGTRDERALGLEGQDRRGLPEVDPAHLVELVVMPVEVAAHGFHHEVVDGLVDPRAGLDEPVFDVVERPSDADLQAGLLADLAQGRLLGGLTALGRALGQGPGPAVAFAPATADRRVGVARPRYRTTMPPADVAVAVLRRATAPSRRGDADPDRIEQHEPNASRPAGRSRPFRMRGRAGRGPRQPARRRA